MFKQKATECVHKINRFQAHKGCNLLASICQHSCQQLHGDVSLMSVDAVDDHFKGIRELLIKQIRKYSDKLKDIYNEMINQLQKQQSENMKQMEGELIKELVKNIALQKGVLEKVENKRYERIKCHELMCFMEESNIEQKIKNSGHISIYQKYQQNILSFKEVFDKFSSQLIQSKSITNVSKQHQNTANQHSSRGQNAGGLIERVQSQQDQNKVKIIEDKYKSLQKEHRIVVSELQKKKYEVSYLNTEKKNLERELAKKNNLRTVKLKTKTWNIFKLSTRKIRKTHQTVIVPEYQHQIPQEQEQEEEIPHEHQNDDDIDSESVQQSHPIIENLVPQQSSHHAPIDNEHERTSEVNNNLNDEELRNQTNQRNQRNQQEKIPQINLQETRALETTTHRPYETISVDKEDKMIPQEQCQHNQKENPNSQPKDNKNNHVPSPLPPPQNNNYLPLSGKDRIDQKQTPPIFQTPEKQSSSQSAQGSNKSQTFIENIFKSSQVPGARRESGITPQKEQEKKDKDIWFLSYFRKK